MKKILLAGLILLLGISPVFATITRTLQHNITYGGSVINGITVPGVPINGTTITAGATITSDSVYQAGSISYGYSAVTLMASAIGGVTPNIKLTYQTSYDNINWFNPTSTTGNGVVSSVSTLDSVVGSGNTWVVYNYTVYPYIRFNLQNNSATTDTVTAETLWQDYV